MNQRVENEESSVEPQAKGKLKEMVGGIATEISEQIHALKSSLESHKYATFQKLSSDRKIRLNLSGEKYELRLSWELSKPPSRTSAT